MSKLVWDAEESRLYEQGVDRGVLFVMADGQYGKGVAWSGLTSVNENPSGAEDNPFYADNIKYLNLKSVEEYGCTIEAYTYPDEWAACDGSAEIVTGVTIGQQARSKFAFSYRTKVGSAAKGDDFGYKIHIIYGAQASPSSVDHGTINDSPELNPFSWEVTTTPITVEGFKPTACLVIDSTKVDAGKLAALEAKLYGTDSEESALPMPAEIVEMLKVTAG